MAIKQKMKSVKARTFTRPIFEALVHNEAKTVGDILEMHKKGLIGEHDYLFTLPAVKTIAHSTYRGGWNNCRLQDNPKSRWSREAGNRNANEFIREAFT